MMKRICIVTWYCSANFGTCLQAYALWRKLSDIGYDVRVSIGVTHANLIKDFFIRLLSPFGVIWLKDYIEAKISHLDEQRKRLRIAQKWSRQNLSVVQMNDSKKTANIIADMDCFVAGSDQIWNTYYQFSPSLFLDFAQKKKRISYASSIGTAGINPEYAGDVAQLLAKFSHIGVREPSAVGALSKLLSRNDIEQVVDPTLLLSKEEWMAILKGAGGRRFVNNEPYLFCYLLGSDKRYVRQVEEVKSRMEVRRLVLVRSAENPLLNIDGACVMDEITPFDFIALLAHSSFVCTDSFHATAFALNFNKPFVEFLRFKDEDERSQNGRIVDFLSHYGLTGRIYGRTGESWAGAIDFRLVNEKLRRDRERSLKWLVDAIEH